MRLLFYRLHCLIVYRTLIGIKRRTIYEFHLVSILPRIALILEISLSTTNRFVSHMAYVGNSVIKHWLEALDMAVNKQFPDGVYEHGLNPTSDKIVFLHSSQIDLGLAILH